MTKKLKAAIFAAAFISLGGAAYTYDRYGVQDNSTLLANIEAMSCNNEENKENSEGGNSGKTYNILRCYEKTTSQKPDVTKYGECPSTTQCGLGSQLYDIKSAPTMDEVCTDKVTKGFCGISNVYIDPSDETNKIGFCLVPED